MTIINYHWPPPPPLPSKMMRIHSRCSNSLWWWWLFVRLLDIVCWYFERIFFLITMITNEKIIAIGQMMIMANQSNHIWSAEKSNSNNKRKKLASLHYIFNKRFFFFFWMNIFSNYFDLIGFKNHLFIINICCCHHHYYWPKRLNQQQRNFWEISRQQYFIHKIQWWKNGKKKQIELIETFGLFFTLFTTTLITIIYWILLIELFWIISFYATTKARKINGNQIFKERRKYGMCAYVLSSRFHFIIWILNKIPDYFLILYGNKKQHRNRLFIHCHS